MKFTPYFLPLVLATAVQAEEIKLSAVVNVRNADNEHARPVLNKNAKNQPLRVAGHDFENGVGTQVDNRLAIDLGGNATRFTALVGIDDGTPDRDIFVRFAVEADGKILWQEDVKKSAPVVKVDVDVTGKKELLLIARDIGNAYTQALADWADATLTFEGTKPKWPSPVRTGESPTTTGRTDVRFRGTGLRPGPGH